MFPYGRDRKLCYISPVFPWVGTSNKEHTMFSLNPTPHKVKTLAIAAVLMVTALLLGLSQTVRAASDNPRGKVSFIWAFGALVGKEGGQRLIEVKPGTILRSGEKFKMMVKPLSDCYIYVIYQDSQGKLTLLFPYSLTQFEKGYAKGTQYLIPQKDAWYQLDELGGREHFYLVASTERLMDVEVLFKEYQTSDADKKSDIVHQLLAIIQRMGVEHLAMAATERPTEIAAGYRGVERAQGADPTNIATLGVEISSQEYFSRTYDIEHR